MMSVGRVVIAGSERGSGERLAPCQWPYDKQYPQ
jgi:hypothetical protein